MFVIRSPADLLFWSYEATEHCLLVLVAISLFHFCRSNVKDHENHFGYRTTVDDLIL